MCFSVEWTGWHRLAAGAEIKSPLPRGLGFPIGYQTDQTQLGVIPSSQLLALNGMAGGGPRPAGKAAPVSKGKEPGLWAAGPGREPG